MAPVLWTPERKESALFYQIKASSTRATRSAGLNHLLLLGARKATYKEEADRASALTFQVSRVPPTLRCSKNAGKLSPSLMLTGTGNVDEPVRGSRH